METPEFLYIWVVILFISICSIFISIHVYIYIHTHSSRSPWKLDGISNGSHSPSSFSAALASLGSLAEASWPHLFYRRAHWVGSCDKTLRETMAFTWFHHVLHCFTMETGVFTRNLPKNPIFEIILWHPWTSLASGMPL